MRDAQEKNPGNGSADTVLAPVLLAEDGLTMHDIVSPAVAAAQSPGFLRYDAACRAVAAALGIDEAKDFRDRAEAMRAYAHQAKNKQLEMDAAEIRFRAERRIGQLMQMQREAGLLNRGTAGVGNPGWLGRSQTDPPSAPAHTPTDAAKARVEDGPEVAKPTLADAGIDKHLADRARKTAALSDGEFEEKIEDWRAEVAEDDKRVVVNLIGTRKPHVANNSGNVEWYTPPEFIEAARMVLGGIDLDPASSAIANGTVQATTFFTADDDGLQQEWPIGRVCMNPPYAPPLIGQFAEKFAREMRRGSTGISLVNNATETAWFQTIAEACSAICFPRSRIRFLDTEGVPSGAPLQGQAILYCGPNPEYFVAEFSYFGLVVTHGPL